MKNAVIILVVLGLWSASAMAYQPPQEGGDSNAESQAVAISGSKAQSNQQQQQGQTTDVDSIGIGNGGKGGNGGHAKGGNGFGTGIARSSNGDQELNVTDSSSTTNINDSDYVVPAHASAGIAFAMLQGCYGIGGVDARGSGPSTAGGLTLNIFKLTNDRCVLAAKALEAQANGNLNGYATMTCADKATWKGYRTVMSAVNDRRVSKNEAIVACVKEVKSVAFHMSTRLAKAEEKTLVLEGVLNEITGGK